MKFHSLHHRLFRQRRFRQMLFGSLILSVLISFIIVPIERTSQFRTIDSFSDGLWWAVQTATTVGYGDVTPVTEMGRILGILMQLMGTVMFGSLIAIISSSMSRSQEELYWSRLFDRIDQLSMKVDNLEHQTRFLVKSEVDTSSDTTPSRKPSS